MHVEVFEVTSDDVLGGTRPAVLSRDAIPLSDAGTGCRRTRLPALLWEPMTYRSLLDRRSAKQELLVGDAVSSMSTRRPCGHRGDRVEQPAAFGRRRTPPRPASLRTHPRGRHGEPMVSRGAYRANLFEHVRAVRTEPAKRRDGPDHPTRPEHSGGLPHCGRWLGDLKERSGKRHPVGAGRRAAGGHGVQSDSGLDRSASRG